MKKLLMLAAVVAGIALLWIAMGSLIKFLMGLAIVAGAYYVYKSMSG